MSRHNVINAGFTWISNIEQHGHYIILMPRIKLTKKLPLNLNLFKYIGIKSNDRDKNTIWITYMINRDAIAFDYLYIISSLFFEVVALHPTYILTTIYSGQYLWAIVSSGFITQILIPNSINEHEQDDPWPQLTGSIYSNFYFAWHQMMLLHTATGQNYLSNAFL